MIPSAARAQLFTGAAYGWATVARCDYPQGAVAGRSHRRDEVPRRAGQVHAADGEVLARYLPQQLTDDELAVLARDAVAAVEEQTGQAPGPRQMGLVMKQATAAAAGRADGKRVAAAVKGLLAAPQ